jgi:hypothetical protein
MHICASQTAQGTAYPLFQCEFAFICSKDSLPELHQGLGNPSKLILLHSFGGNICKREQQKQKHPKARRV